MRYDNSDRALRVSTLIRYPSFFSLEYRRVIDCRSLFCVPLSVNEGPLISIWSRRHYSTAEEHLDLIMTKWILLLIFNAYILCKAVSYSTKDKFNYIRKTWFLSYAAIHVCRWMNKCTSAFLYPYILAYRTVQWLKRGC